ncbi:hypothetical protein BKA62DRAFT_675999 [Auriculariales sp. MPI-PUGE-AT-0066]|nr:hypothetical protein BKA62DRAFT_675999 [Auriculariales sp. MPI-PUGE-AT-0066]
MQKKYQSKRAQDPQAPAAKTLPPPSLSALPLALAVLLLLLLAVDTRVEVCVRVVVFVAEPPFDVPAEALVEVVVSEPLFVFSGGSLSSPGGGSVVSGGGSVVSGGGSVPSSGLSLYGKHVEAVGAAAICVRRSWCGTPCIVLPSDKKGTRDAESRLGRDVHGQNKRTDREKMCFEHTHDEETDRRSSAPRVIYIELNDAVAVWTE